jgi:hypothetical protein
MSVRTVVAVALLAAASVAATPHLAAQAPVPMKTYTDPANGVTFQYPSAWVPTAQAPSYLGPSFTTGSDNPTVPQASFTFVSDGNLYAKTLLLSITFTYFAVPAKDAASCLQLAKNSTGSNTPAKSVTIHGLQFQEVDGSDAGMCHEQGNQIDVIYRNNQCFAFERDFNTECNGAGDHKRNLTAAENKALQRHLDTAMQSVVFSK